MKKTLTSRFGKMILLFLSVLSPAFALAQLSDWKNYTNYNKVSDMLNDGDYLWIATDGGLIRLNKKTDEKTFYDRAKYGLPDNHLRALAKDKEGNLWITSQYNGVAKFDGEKCQIYDETNSDIPYEQWCTAITIDQSNNKWIASLLWLNKFDGNKWESWTSPGSEIAMMWYLNAITFDNDSTLWVGGDGPPKFHFGKFNGTEIEICEEIRDAVYGIAVDQNNIKWLATDGGLVKCDGNNYTWFTQENSELPDNALPDIKVDKAGNIWMPCDKYLVKFDGTRFTKYKNEEMGHFIYCIELDEENNTVWIGTINDGVFKFKDGQFEKVDISSPLLSNTITSLHIDAKDNVWFGTINGLSQLDRDGNWHHYFQKDGYRTTTRIYTANTDRQGNLWVSLGLSDTCVVKISPDKQITAFTTKNSMLRPGDPWAITEFFFDKDGNTWGGAYCGLFRYNGTKWELFTPENTPLVSYQTGDLVMDKDGNMWGGCAERYVTGTGKGKGCLFKYDGVNWTIWTTENSGLPTNAVGPLAFDSKNNLWIGTWDEYLSDDPDTGGGLTKFDGTNWTTLNKSNSGIPSNTIGSIVVDQNDHLWLATTGLTGLTYYDGTNWTTFNTKNSGIGFDGVGAIVFDHYRSLLWLSCTRGGLSSAKFDLGSGIDNRKANEASFKIFQSPSTKEITLTYPENFMPERMEIYDTSGGLVYSGRLNGEERACTYPLATLNINQRGLYLIKVSDGKQSRTTKFSTGH